MPPSITEATMTGSASLDINMPLPTHANVPPLLPPTGESDDESDEEFLLPLKPLDPPSCRDEDADDIDEDADVDGARFASSGKSNRNKKSSSNRSSSSSRSSSSGRRKASRSPKRRSSSNSRSLKTGSNHSSGSSSSLISARRRLKKSASASSTTSSHRRSSSRSKRTGKRSGSRSRRQKRSSIASTDSTGSLTSVSSSSGYGEDDNDAVSRTSSSNSLFSVNSLNSFASLDSAPGALAIRTGEEGVGAVDAQNDQRILLQSDVFPSLHRTDSHDNDDNDDDDDNSIVSTVSRQSDRACLRDGNASDHGIDSARALADDQGESSPSPLPSASPSKHRPSRKSTKKKTKSSSSNSNSNSSSKKKSSQSPKRNSSGSSKSPKRRRSSSKSSDIDIDSLATASDHSDLRSGVVSSDGGKSSREKKSSSSTTASKKKSTKSGSSKKTVKRTDSDATADTIDSSASPPTGSKSPTKSKSKKTSSSSKTKRSSLKKSTSSSSSRRRSSKRDTAPCAKRSSSCHVRRSAIPYLNDNDRRDSRSTARRLCSASPTRRRSASLHQRSVPVCSTWDEPVRDDTLSGRGKRSILFDANEVSLRTARTILLNDALAPPKRSVTFGQVRVYEHAICLGDNPAVSDGIPIALDWECLKRTTVPLASPRSSFQVPIWPAQERWRILSEMKYSREQLLEARNATRQAKAERQQTIQQLHKIGLVKSGSQYQLEERLDRIIRRDTGTDDAERSIDDSSLSSRWEA